MTSNDDLLPSALAFIHNDAENNGDTLFYLAGMIIGKVGRSPTRYRNQAVYECVLLDAAELSPIFLNRVMGEINYLDDLKYADPAMHKNLHYIKNCQVWLC